MLAHEGIADAIDTRRLADLRQALAWPLHWQDAQPQRAHALLKLQRTGAYTVSVRAPLRSPSGADVLCSQFGGGGRARAGGIDGLPADDLERFLAGFAALPAPAGASSSHALMTIGCLTSGR